MNGVTGCTFWALLTKVTCFNNSNHHSVNFAYVLTIVLSFKIVYLVGRHPYEAKLRLTERSHLPGDTELSVK